MEIIEWNEQERWNQIVKSFPDWDIYYLNEYAQSLKLHGDGLPRLIYSGAGAQRLCYAVLQEDISEAQSFRGLLPTQMYYDWSTPYGYGGPLTDGVLTSEWIEAFVQDLKEWCIEAGIITQFFRFHPLLQNQKVLETVSDVVYMKKTVYIDTSSLEIIWKNMTPNNRNMVRKAEKNGVQILMDRGERAKDFQQIYEATMKSKQADAYYFFQEDYFQYLIKHFSDHMLFIYAYYEEKPISASIFFYNDKYIHYHLSGTLPEYRKLAAANLILTRAAEWAAKRGIRALHLGGGVDAKDSLLAFKKHFNRNGELDFCIGRNIFDKERFEELVDLRKQTDTAFDVSRPFLITYRG